MKKILLLAIFTSLLIIAFGCTPAEEPVPDQAESEEPAQEEPSTPEAEETESVEQPEAEESEAVETEDVEASLPEKEKEPAMDKVEFSSIEELLGKYDWQDFGEDIKYFDVKEGSGDIVNAGGEITAFYTLWNSKGDLLQTNVGRSPFTTNVGVGRLIQGWDKTIPGLRVGTIRRLIVPGSQAYGDSPPPGSGIEENETLVFELQLVEPR